MTQEIIQKITAIATRRISSVDCPRKQQQVLYQREQLVKDIIKLIEDDRKSETRLLEAVY
jgi:hypothetical protein